MIISVGVQYEYGDYTISIEGVIGSFDLSWIHELEVSVEEFIGEYCTEESDVDEFYATIVMQLRTEFDKSTNSTDIFFDKISLEAHGYI